ncbi:MAG: hypothetical protein Q9O74_06805 [Planctomycetota bacterium]|nr:hypothetical protein [Planctomycetota bacterium]
MRLGSETAAVRVFGASEALAVCVLVETPKNAEPALRVLRTTVDAAVYAGCVLDGSGDVREWLEIWVQSPPVGDADAQAANANNALLDTRWARSAAARRELEPGRVIGGAWESVHPGPTVFDMDAGCVRVLGEGEEGGPWELCTDDARLTAAGLPGYGASLSRYLWRPALGAESPLVCVSGDDRAGWRELCGAGSGSGSGAMAFNPACGLMFVRRLAGVGFESYIDWLSRGQFHRPPTPKMPAVGRELAREDPVELSLAHGAFMSSVGGAAGLAAEVLYLKLRAIASAVESVAVATEHLDSPLLSLGSESLGVEIPPPSVGLPYAWGSRVVLDCVAEAAEVGAVEPGAPRRFTYQRSGQTSVYRPGGDAGPVARSMAVRIKRVVGIEAGRVSIEGTVLPREPIRTGGSTLATVPLAVPGGRMEFHAFLTLSDALSQGEFGFTSLPLQVTDAEESELRRLEGVEVGDVAVVLSPSLSSPADLHALGVLALRALVADSAESLGTAVVTAMSLARELPEAGEEQLSIAARVAAIAEQDPRWREVLGPQRLMAGAGEAGQIEDGIPLRLWWGVIGTICRMFPGAGRESYCSDFGVGSGRRLASIYDEPLADLGGCLVQARSLLVVDRQTCEEVGGVLDRHLALISPVG